jgi:hypothetical protein
MRNTWDEEVEECEDEDNCYCDCHMAPAMTADAARAKGLIVTEFEDGSFFVAPDLPRYHA